MYKYYKSNNDNSAKCEALFRRKSAVKDCRYVYWPKGDLLCAPLLDVTVSLCHFNVWFIV